MVQHRKKRNEDSFTAFLKVALMLKLSIFVTLFVIKIMLNATKIQNNSSRVNNLPVHSEVVHNILHLQLHNDSRYDD